MSIKLSSTNNYLLCTAGNDLWVSQASASFSVFLMITPGSNLAALVNAAPIGGLYTNTKWNLTFGAVSGQTIALTPVMRGAIHSCGTTVQISAGVVYHIAGVWQSGSQALYVNGIQVKLLTFAELTSTITSTDMRLAGAPAGAGVELSDAVTWNGYALSPTEIVAIRDGGDPASIGSSATTRVRWRFDGAVGSAVAPGDPAIKNAFGGSTSYDLTLTSGTGAGVYTAPLVLTPAANAALTVLTGGTLVRAMFSAAVNGVPATPSLLITAPTIAVNGTVVGQLQQLDLAGTCSDWLFRIPGGVSVDPADAVTFSAPMGWANTSTGITFGATNAPVENRVGRSAFGTDALVKTLKPGMNMGWSPNESNPGVVLKNWAAKLGLWLGGTVFDRNGNGTMPSTTDQGRIFYETFGSCTNVNEMVPHPDGVYAIGWDDLDAANGYPTDFTLGKSAGSDLTITELAGCRNPGVNGVGKVRLYQITHNTLLTAVQLYVNLSCSTKAPKISNFVFYPPGSFSYTPGVKCDLDKSDPLALDPMMLARFPNGIGSVRCIDTTWGASGLGGGEYEPEDARTPTDLATGVPLITAVGCSAIRPWDPAVSPYVYSSHFGQTYQATLGASITDLGSIDSQGRRVSTIIVTDASTAPIIAGQRLTIDSEEMGVLSVNGTSILVRRGSRSTTPATHTSGVGTLGSVTVSFRFPISSTTFRPNSRVIEVVLATPGVLMTGPLYHCTTTSSWGSQAMTDGGSIGFSDGYITPFLTGPNTFLTLQDAIASSGPYTASTTTSLNSSLCQLKKVCPSSSYPIEVITRIASTFGADAHVGLPICANDDFVDAIARRVRDTMPAGRKVYLEYGCEPWNTFPPWYFQWAFSYHLSYMLNGPGGDLRAWNIDRTQQVGQRFKAIFNEGGRNRGGEVHVIYNHQFVNTGGAITSEMDYIGSKGYDIDVVAVAPYTGALGFTTSSTVALYRGATIPEGIDILINGMWYGANGSFAAIRQVSLSFAASVAAYNAKYGKSAFLYGYEGGDQDPWPTPGVISVGNNYGFTLGAAVGASDATITLGSGQAAKLGIGDDLMICAQPFGRMAATDEWVRITGINGNVLTVTRGLYGTSNQSHASGKAVVSDFFLKARDLEYHPNWRICFKDFIAILQQAGFQGWNRYAYAMPWPYGKAWGTYTTSSQLPGKGDGSDGKTDNRLYLAQRGLPNSVTAGVIQDMRNVSVVGQAINEWMADARSGNVVVPPKSSSRTAKRFVPRPRFR
ncbi:LamG domain-containing protein [Aquisphaera insulae]|uniref:LamG domain-containing protein n=1 Tax=Aquisphaera insulae TaxID=2712864 RepID=UPI0013EBC4E8|nr:LamG domain-containing protein [Aquisphaera insulae]